MSHMEVLMALVKFHFEHIPTGREWWITQEKRRHITEYFHQIRMGLHPGNVQIDFQAGDGTLVTIPREVVSQCKITISEA